MSWQALTTTPNDLGESPFWHPQEQRLYWADIPGKQILRTDLATRKVERWDLPTEPGCIAPAAKGGLVMALRDGLYRARHWGAPLTLLARIDYNPAQMRANDGKCDALGRFWVGTIDETKVARNAGLYVLDCRGGRLPELRCQLDPRTFPATTANGLAWSADGHTLYWADTPSHTVHAWDFEVQANTLSRHRTLAQVPPKPVGWQPTDYAPHNGGYQGRPDGAAVDVQGNYYAAMFEGRRLCKFAPDGTLLAELATPAQCPTMPCFGGQDLQTLFITTARHGRSAAELAAFPQSGCVFFKRMDVPGLPVNCFAD